MIPPTDCFVGRKENRDYSGSGENLDNETANKYTINKRYIRILDKIIPLVENTHLYCLDDGIHLLKHFTKQNCALNKSYKYKYNRPTDKQRTQQPAEIHTAQLLHHSNLLCMLLFIV